MGLNEAARTGLFPGSGEEGARGPPAERGAGPVQRGGGAQRQRESDEENQREESSSTESTHQEVRHTHTHTLSAHVYYLLHEYMESQSRNPFFLPSDPCSVRTCLGLFWPQAGVLSRCTWRRSGAGSWPGWMSSNTGSQRWSSSCRSLDRRSAARDNTNRLRAPLTPPLLLRASVSRSQDALVSISPLRVCLSSGGDGASSAAGGEAGGAGAGGGRDGHHRPVTAQTEPAGQGHPEGEGQGRTRRHTPVSSLTNTCRHNTRIHTHTHLACKHQACQTDTHTYRVGCMQSHCPPAQSEPQFLSTGLKTNVQMCICLP